VGGYGIYPDFGVKSEGCSQGNVLFLEVVLDVFVEEGAAVGPETKVEAGFWVLGERR
jgi:hypothetical protein